MELMFDQRGRNDSFENPGKFSKNFALPFSL
jgi:hypothetical protein